MAETTISWTSGPNGEQGYTFNPWIGCTRVSPACDGCYAAHLMQTRMGRVIWGGPGIGAGTRERTAKANWSKPQTWDRLAAARMASWDALPPSKRKGPRPVRPFVFCASLADVFDNEVPPVWRADLFELIRSTPNLVWLLLTKRPQNILKMVKAAGGLPPNVALGTTVEDVQRLRMNGLSLLATLGALEYIDQTPALFGFLSCEPLLEALDLSELGAGWAEHISWIITGGETDQGSHKARPSNPGWFRSIRDQTLAAGALYHHKQNGEWLEAMHMQQEEIPTHALSGRTGWESVAIDGQGLFWKVGKSLAGRRLDCIEHNGRPVA